MIFIIFYMVTLSVGIVIVALTVLAINIMRIILLLFTLIHCIKTRFISSSSLVNISHFLIILFNRKILGSKYVNMSVRMHTTNLSFSYLSLSYSYLSLSISFSCLLHLPPYSSFLIVLNFISVTCENV